MIKLSPEAKAELNRKLDKEAQEMVARGRGEVDPTGKPTIGVDVRDPKPVEENPILKAFSITKGAGGWSMVTVSYRDGNLVDVVRTEPNLKTFAINDFKKAAFHYWSSLG